MSKTRSSHVTQPTREKVGVQCAPSVLLGPPLSSPVSLIVIYLYLLDIQRNPNTHLRTSQTNFFVTLTSSGQTIRPLYGDSRIEIGGQTR